jgi:hypothetical protein
MAGASAHVSEDDAPADRASGGVYAAAARAQSEGRDLPAPLPVIWDPGIRWKYDVSGCHHAAIRTEFFLLKLCQRHGIPATDHVARVIELLTIFVEINLLHRLSSPDHYDDGEPEEEEIELNEDYALAAGLTIHPRREQRKKKNLLPDCRSETFTGVKCDRLRPPGERFCTRCGRIYLLMMRARECGRVITAEQATALYAAKRAAARP